MTTNSDKKYLRYLFIVATCCLSVSSLFAQNTAANKTSEFCSRADSFNNGSGVTTLDLRETTLPARSLIAVDIKRHGSISIRGGDRSDILVRACVQTWGISDGASRALARDIRIETDQVIQAVSGGANENVWSIATISYEILVPQATNLNLSTWNGNISIVETQGKIEFKALNGNLSLQNLAGDVRGRTTNGNVSVALLGKRWAGERLDVETTNGGVDLNLPENYAANLEIGTGSGTFYSKIGGFQSEKRNQAVRFNKPLNGGGAPVRVITVNGAVRLNNLGSSR